MLTGDSITASVGVSSFPVVLAAAAAVAAAISAASRRKGRIFIVLVGADGVRRMLNRYSLRLGCCRTKSDEMVHEQQVSSPFLASFSSSSFFDRLPAAMTKRKQNYSLKASFSSSSLFARLPAAMKKRKQRESIFLELRILLRQHLSNSIDCLRQ